MNGRTFRQRSLWLGLVASASMALAGCVADVDEFEEEPVGETSAPMGAPTQQRVGAQDAPGASRMTSVSYDAPGAEAKSSGSRKLLDQSLAFEPQPNPWKPTK